MGTYPQIIRTINAIAVDAMSSDAVKEIKSAYEQLKPTERVFVDAYIATDNPRGAAIRALPELKKYPPSAADPRAMEYMKRPLIVAAIAERLREITSRLEITAEKTMQEVAKIAYANMADYVRITDMGEPFVDLSDVTRDQMAAISEVTVEDVKEGRGPDAREIRKVRFKLHDKMNGLDKLMKALGMNAPERVELSGPGGSPIQTQSQVVTINMTTEQAAELYAKSLRGE